MSVKHPLSFLTRTRLWYLDVLKISILAQIICRCSEHSWDLNKALCRQNDTEEDRKGKSKSDSHVSNPKYTYEELVNMSSDLAKGDIDLDYKVNEKVLPLF